jgi:hypothetical protein
MPIEGADHTASTHGAAHSNQGCLACWQGLIARQTPGYAIGGLAGGEDKVTFCRVVAQCTAVLPPGKPRYVMGIGCASRQNYLVYASPSLWSDCCSECDNYDHWLLEAIVPHTWHSNSCNIAGSSVRAQRYKICNPQCSIMECRVLGCSASRAGGFAC